MDDGRIMFSYWSSIALDSSSPRCIYHRLSNACEGSDETLKKFYLNSSRTFEMLPLYPTNPKRTGIACGWSYAYTNVWEMLYGYLQAFYISQFFQILQIEQIFSCKSCVCVCGGMMNDVIILQLQTINEYRRKLYIWACEAVEVEWNAERNQCSTIVL